MSRETIQDVLTARGSRYGEYADNSKVAMAIWEAIASGTNFASLHPYHKLALQMLSAKVARIVNGDPDYEDNWVDIIGYAELTLREIRNGKD